MTPNLGPLDILAITFPIFAIIAIGYGAVKSQYFPKEGSRFLSIFVIQVAIPAMLFKALSEKHINEIFDIEFFSAYAIGSLITFFAVLVVSQSIYKNSTHSAITAAGSCSSNTAFIGLPIALAYFGEKAIIGVALAFIFENIIILPVILAFIEKGAGERKSFTQALLGSIKNLSKSPLVLAAVAGVLFSIFDIKIPTPISKVIGMVSLTSGGVALFAIGGFLVGVSVQGMLKKIAYITFAKLIIHPLAVLLIILVLPPFDPVLQGTAVLLAAMPMFSIYPIIGQKVGEEKICAAALLLTTICSFATISGLLWLLHYLHY
jgi:malonate transporter